MPEYEGFIQKNRSGPRSAAEVIATTLSDIATDRAYEALSPIIEATPTALRATVALDVAFRLLQSSTSLFASQGHDLGGDKKPTKITDPAYQQWWNAILSAWLCAPDQEKMNEVFARLMPVDQHDDETPPDAGEMS